MNDNSALIATLGGIQGQCAHSLKTCSSTVESSPFRSSPKARLHDLPSNLLQHVTTFLHKAELLSLRSVSAEWKRHTALALSRQISQKLQTIIIHATEEGLRTFQGLCVQSEFRALMEEVIFVHIKCQDRDI